MSDDQHIAVPKLYGAPAYARPPAPIATAPRPFDPDELPIEAHQTAEEREFTSSLPARAYRPGGIDLHREVLTESTTSTGLRPRSFSIRGIAGRILGS